METKQIIIYAILALIFSLGMIGCTYEPNIPSEKGTYEEISFDYDKDIKTQQFASSEELLNFIKDNSGGGIYYETFGMIRQAVAEIAMDEAVEMEESVAVPSAAPAVEKGVASGEDLDFSETNIQVQGVDEADIIKTDGNYIYTVSGNVLFIIKAYPGEDAEIISTMKFDNRPESIFIYEDYLAVFGNFNDNDYFKKIDFRPRYGMTYLNIYDTFDKENPELVKEYKFEGSYFRGRMTNGYMYILTTTRPEIRPIPMPLIVEDTVARYMPISDIYYYNIRYDDPMFVNIHAISMVDPDDMNSKAIAVEGSQNLYMSAENIYITYTEYINEYDLQKEIIQELLEPKLSQSDKELIEKIKQTDNDVLSRSEKEAKIYQVYQTVLQYLPQDEQEELADEAEALLKKKLEEYEYFEFTVINKVNVNKEDIDPVANGKVPGSIINQFSMDENNDIFRIATTVSPRWSRFSERTKATNNIYTLDEDLEILDELEGLAEDEQIYSTRFIGDRLYMVTFKQVDPFFVIDLSNPNNIKELGKLKIPGFSRYLHPYDKDTIIGIGQDATETGRTKGLKISLFDVSDVENPKEIAKYVTESRYASSSALYEHKAFLFSKEKNLLVIPAYNYNYQDQTENYNGAFVFDISKDKIELQGLIDHSEGKIERYWQPYVERSLYIEELLYTKSSGLLRINKIEDLSTVKNIELKYSDPGIPIY